MSDKQLECRTQCRYTPDAGTEHAENVLCGVCKTVMDKIRDCHGPRSYAEAMAKRSTYSSYDEWTCPNTEEDWHKQVIALYKEADATASKVIKSFLEIEAVMVLNSKSPTLEKYWG